MILGRFPCDACDRVGDFTDKNCSKGIMRCGSCDTTQPRRQQPVEFRIDLFGQLTIGQLEQAIGLARRFGADDDVPLNRDRDGLHHFALSAVGVDARLRIEEARGGAMVDGR